MSYVHVDDDQPKELVPASAVKAVGLLLLAVLVLAGIARYTGVGAVSSASLEAGEPIAQRWIVFEAEDPEGWVRLVDGRSGGELRALPPGEGGFLRGAVRPLHRERMRAGVDLEDPYELTLWSEGALTLRDLGTGVVVDLNAFGPTNAEAFRALLALP
jgi:putative photosynthetic complex assembly protein